MEITNSEILHKTDSISIMKYQLTDPTTGHSKTKIYWKFKTNSVIIIPKLSDGRFIIIKNQRFGQEKKNYEFPGGGQELNESPLETAHRELLEEVGAKGKIKHIGSFFPVFGLLNLKTEVFYAEVEEQNSKWISLDPGEDIEHEFVTIDEIEAIISDGNDLDSYFIIPYTLYKLKIK